MKPNRKYVTWLLASVLLVGVAVFTISYTANPLSKLKIENIATINVTRGARLNPPTELPATEYRRIIETLRATRVDLSPYKWPFVGRMEISSSNGDITVLRFYETGDAEGVFRIGKTYYRFTGDLGSLTSSAAEDG